MIFRKLRCLMVVLLVLTTHLLILGYINDWSTTSPLALMAKPMNFWTKVHTIFNNEFVIPWHNGKLEEEDVKRMYLLNTDNDPVNHAILVPDVYISDNETPDLLQYDPRFTTSLILKFFGDSLKYDNNVKNLQLPYFDWSDYVDLSMLNEYLIKSPEEKPNCDMFNIGTGSESRDRKHQIIDPKWYCLNDDDLDKQENSFDDYEQLKVNRIKSKRSPGFHIRKYGGRSKKHLKILHSKSYLNDFMPTPFSMVLLLPIELNDMGGQKFFGNALQININTNQYGNEKLVDTPLLKNFKQDRGDLNLDVNRELNYFLENLQQSNHKPNDEINYEKTLTHDLFIDNSSDIYAQLSTKSDLDIHERNYLNSLDMSLNSPYPPKYFSEAKLTKDESKYELGSHYDWRFFNGLINYTSDLSPTLFGLIKAWLQFINHFKINSWLAHGTLLSWYWNSMALPWDTDFDVQMSIQDLHLMCKQFNQSLIMDLGNDFQSGELRYSKYFLDCGSYISQRQRGNTNNNIDARFIDINTGIYIDITGLALTDTESPKRYDALLPDELRKNSKDQTVSHLNRNEFLKIYNCRNNHFQSLEDLAPMRLSFYEGQLTYIPNNYRSMLINEYKESSIKYEKFNAFTFIKQYNLWVVTKDVITFVKKKYPDKAQNLRKYRGTNNLGKKIPEAKITDEFETDDDFVEFICKDKDLLFEYILTEPITSFHKQEMELLNNGKSSKGLFFNDGQLAKSFKPVRHDSFNYKSFMKDYNFVRENEQLLKDIETWKLGNNQGDGEKIDSTHQETSANPPDESQHQELQQQEQPPPPQSPPQENTDHEDKDQEIKDLPPLNLQDESDPNYNNINRKHD